MAHILPFKGLRPAPHLVHLVVTHSVDHYTQPEVKQQLAENPFSFLQIIKADVQQGQKWKQGAPEQLRIIKEKYKSFQENHTIISDSKPAYYVYRQSHSQESFTGIVARIGIDDYENGVIRVHEQTLTEKEEKLKRYLEVCDFNAEPVCFSYPPQQNLDDFIRTIQKEETPVYDFSTQDAIRHTLWKLDDADAVDFIQRMFSSMPAVYIADGHHRSASSARLGNYYRDKKGKYSGNEGFNYYMGIFFPENQLKIFDFNRVVRDLNGLSANDFLSALSEKFTVNAMGDVVFKPKKIHQFSLYLDGQFYCLEPKGISMEPTDPIGNLDAYLLTQHILGPILNIWDLKTDKRVSFIPGIKGMEELKRQVDGGKNAAAFGLFPVSMSQLKTIADTQNIMPPKTTWIEPKLRSGLVIYDLARHGY